MIALPVIRSRKPVSATAGIRKRRDNPEERLQMAVAKYLRAALGGNTTFFHPANGGYRRLTEAKRFKAMGVMPGLPDIAIIDSGRIIWIELKADAGRLSAVQAWCHEQLGRARCPPTVCRSVEEVEAVLRAAGVPLRAKVAA